jgi:hypothetical protein
VIELIEKPCLTNPRFANNTHHLPVPVACLNQDPGEEIQLFATTDKGTEADNRGSVRSCRGARCAGQLIDLLWVGNALDGYGTERLDLHQALDELQRLLAQQRRPRCGKLLHSRCQMSGFSHRGVFHEEIVSDAANHHLT